MIELCEEFIICYARGYPDPFSPVPNTIESASKFQRKHGGQIKRRLRSEWQDVDPVEKGGGEIDDEFREYPPRLIDVAPGDVWYESSMPSGPVTIKRVVPRGIIDTGMYPVVIGITNRGDEILLEVEKLIEKGERLWPR